MATVKCILKYQNSQLTKTYQVTFDQKDTINVVTETEGLVIKASNQRAKDLFPALKHESTGQGHRPSIAAGESYEFDPPLAPAAAPAELTKKSQFCFSVDQQHLAKFSCGFRKDGKFTPYPVEDGPEFPTG